MRIKSQISSLSEMREDACAVLIVQDKKGVAQHPPSLGKQLIERLLSATSLKDFTAKEGEVLSLYTEKAIASPRLIAVGLGESEKATLEKLRRAAAAAAKTAQGMKIGSLGIEFPSPGFLPPSLQGAAADVAQAIVEGAALASYKYDRYISPEDGKKKLESILVFTSEKKLAAEIQKGVKFGDVITSAVCHARDLENAPSNEIYPESLWFDAQQTAHAHGFKASVFDLKKIESLKMGGILAVGRGSSHPPRFLTLEHNAQKGDSGTIVLVGKGVTFDSGGISIKPAANMAEMKMDMSGAAAVLGAFQAIADLQLPLHVYGLIPAVENMPSGSAVKPGDIIRHFNGKTSEVDNTDAEGRLILADALAYAAKLRPAVVIDIATLTGACVVALGHVATGMMGNDQPTMDKLKAAGDRTHELVWQLPLFEEYEKLIKSEVADVKNTGGRWAGAITGGWFLKKFIGEYKWVHLDIAGTAILEENADYAPKGGSGVGVRLLVDFLRNWK